MGRIIARCLGSLAAASALLLLPSPWREREPAPRPESPAFWAPESPRLEVLLLAPSGPDGPLEVAVRNLGQERTLRVTGTLRLGGEVRRFRTADLWASEETSRRFPVRAPGGADGADEARDSGCPSLSWDLSWRGHSGRCGREEGVARLGARQPAPPAPCAVPDEAMSPLRP